MSEPTPDKITVTYDDLNTRKVEQRLKEQDALTRNRAYAALDESAVGPAADAPPPGTLAALWRNGIFALAFFGLVGGLLAWACGALLDFKADLRADTAERLAGIAQLITVTEAGNLTPDQARTVIDTAIADGSERNPHFALAVVRPDAEFRRKALDRVTVLAQAKVLSADEAKREADKILADGQRNEDFKAMTDPALPDAAKLQKLKDQAAARDAAGEQILATENVRSLIGNVLAYGVRGVILGVLLAIAIPVTENNVQAIIINGSVGAALGLIGGVAAAFVTGGIQRLVAGADPESVQHYLATIATWGVLGLFLTLAPGIVMRNPKKLAIGLTGGLIGGLIGGVLFEPLSNLPALADYPRVPELVAMVAIGLLAGLATGLIENAAKTGWLKVVQGLIAGKQFILYRNPTFIGAGPDCQIYLFKDPKVGKRHAAIHIVPGGFEIEDLPLGVDTLLNGKPTKRTRLKNGDRIQIGSTQLVFMEKAQAA
ncbi:MAG: hypothetical protein AVDCRST_MAG64-1337 [uncultured Phycisphaerae bacterium]|uniref:FHA domain-containing protein n=1 Tax=uncultured Phycisphaerae bacterium TaxID=904963 RepID=A0A6J4NUL9_9BACT|nr:MAG: hypothetical protein AVDCRST_MAG64-1337 [uncultured Phycisphaerae bacterium]